MGCGQDLGELRVSMCETDGISASRVLGKTKGRDEDRAKGRTAAALRRSSSGRASGKAVRKAER